MEKIKYRRHHTNDWPQKKYSNIQLHLIGPLQTNKIKIALEVFDIIETLDREKLAKKISMNLDKNKKTHEFFVQVNTGNEPQKSGIKLSEVNGFVDWVRNDMNLNVTGLMCIPPIDDDPSNHFRVLSEKRDDCGLRHLSMGMSNDYETALSFGSTFIRVGSAIFGKRTK